MQHEVLHPKPDMHGPLTVPHVVLEYSRRFPAFFLRYRRRREPRSMSGIKPAEAHRVAHFKFQGNLKVQ
jgi:hypothetical protein